MKMMATTNLLKSIFLEAKNKLVKEISELFGIVDEEHITFAFILFIKQLINENKGKLKDAVFADILNILNNVSKKDEINRDEINAYVNNSLIIEVKMHNRAFESQMSGSDYGLIFDIPELDIFNKIVQPYYNGILIQAKRNALKGKKFDSYGELSNLAFDFSIVRHFMSLGLYKFEKDNSDTKLSDIMFVPLEFLKCDDKSFASEINNILKNPEEYQDMECLDAEKFFSLFFERKIGTSNNSEIEKYILGSKLPIIVLEISFPDDGKELLNIIFKKSNKEKTQQRLRQSY